MGASEGASSADQSPSPPLTDEERLEQLKNRYLADILAVAEAQGDDAASDPAELLQKLEDLQQEYQQAAPVVAAGAGVQLDSTGQTHTAGSSDLDRLTQLQEAYGVSGTNDIAPVRVGPQVSSAPVQPGRPQHAVPQISIEPEGLHLVQTALAPTDTEAMEMSAGSALLSLVNIVQL